MTIVVPVATQGWSWSFPPQNFVDWFTLGYLAVLVIAFVATLWCLVSVIRT